MKHRVSWILWLAVSSFLVLSTRNPYYLSLQLFALVLLGDLLAVRKSRSKWLASNILFLFIVLILSAVINTVFSHQGKTVIFELPQGWLIIGGIYTLESLIYGLINGLVITILFLIFNIINMALTTRQITYLIPKVFYPIAIMLTISLTFFPTIQRRIGEIKEAQQLRGNQMKRISDWIPIILPLLITSLENSFTLSESMTTRGFHSQNTVNSARNFLIGIVLSFFLIFSAWILQLYNYPTLLTTSLYITSGAIMILTLFLANKKITVTRFYQEKWDIVDIVSSLFFALVIIILVILKISGSYPQLSYSPYPEITKPLFNFSDVLLNLPILFPLMTFLFKNRKNNDTDQ